MEYYISKLPFSLIQVQRLLNASTAKQSEIFNLLSLRLLLHEIWITRQLLLHSYGRLTLLHFQAWSVWRCGAVVFVNKDPLWTFISALLTIIISIYQLAYFVFDWCINEKDNQTRSCDYHPGLQELCFFHLNIPICTMIPIKCVLI